ncbi:TonB-dependent receptor [Cupriavidus basilensis]|uniref:TonB-dependent receptor n=1 Tax=Cupriavidus basilensis TaxID=68895 RepID=A0ABT6AUU7_9BURK|nr:TonB-dependent receptor [Cupriavidus basilensis]MDF3836392.1 TonB-dependent receptor [Cupriavidus basilensis]
MSARPRIARTAGSGSFRQRYARPSRKLAHHCALALSLGAFASLGTDAAWAADDTQTAERPQSRSSRKDGTVLPPVVVSSSAQPPTLALSEPASTGSRLGLTPLETPASVEALSGETVRERGDLSVREAVSRATGITANGTPGNGGTALTARGFSGQGSVMQLYDGTRLYVASGTVTFPFDTWSADRIEVLRGAASVMVGEGAIGGVVNVIPKKPLRAPVANELQVTGGTQRTARAAFDSGGAVNENLSYRFNASYGRSGGWVDRGDSRATAVSAAVRLDVSPAFNVTLSHDDGDQHPMQYFGTPLVDGSLDTTLRKKNYNAGDSEITYRDRWTRLAAQWQPNERVTMRNQFYYLTSQRHWRNAESYTFLPASGQVRRTDYLEILHDQEQVGDRADLKIDGQLFGMANTAMAGFDVNRIHFTNSSNSPYGGTSTVGAWQFDPGQFINPPGIATSPRFRTHTTQYALFGEDRLKLTRQWSVIGGVRLDHAELERGNLVSGDAWRRTFNNITWRAGTVYAFTPALSAYAQYATATDPLNALVSTSDAQKDFKLATGRQIEAGVKQSFWNQRGEWTFAAYQIVKKNLLTPDASNPTLSVQAGQQSSRGLEASVSVELTRGLRLDANGTVLRARFDDFAEKVNGALVSRNGSIPANVPQQAANLWLTWAFAPQWQLGSGLRYVGKRYSNNANTASMPSYTVVDASLQWRVSRRTALTLRVYNLFNRDYAESFGNSGAQWLLGRPRAAELSASFYF